MNIRVATLEDGPRIIEMAVRFLETTSYKQTVVWTEDALVNFIQEVLAYGTIYLAETEDLRVVGMIALIGRFHPLNGSPFGDELAWWVDEAYRKGTAAYRLLWAAEEWTRLNHLSVLKLVAPAGSTIGTAYEKRGYALVETVYQKTFTQPNEVPMPPKDDHKPKDGKQHVRDAMAKHTNPKDRFLTFANGILDQAQGMIGAGATPEEMATAISGLRASLDEAWADIQGK